MLEPVSESEQLLWDAPGIASIIYDWVLIAAGLSTALWGFWATKWKSYLLIALFFTAPLFGLLWGLGAKPSSAQLTEAHSVPHELLLVEDNITSLFSKPCSYWGFIW